MNRDGPSFRVVLGAFSLGFALFGVPALAAPPAWLIEEGDARVYLVGTIHMLPEGTAWWSKPFEGAFRETDTLWLEIDLLDPPNLPALIGRFASTQTPLSERLSAETRARLEALLSRHGLAPDAFEQAEPWFAYMNLSTLATADMGLLASEGMDIRLSREAQARNIPVEGLESYADQFSALAGLEMGVQVALLDDTVNAYDDMVAELALQIESWVSGDLTALESLTREMRVEYPALFEALMAERNRGFVDRIETLLEGRGTHMVAVGLGHFTGPQSIPEMLAGRGVEVRPWPAPL